MTNHTPRCAREGCSQPVYLGNAIALPSSIGALIVSVCVEHFAEYLQRPVALHAQVADHRVTLSALTKAGRVPASALDENQARQQAKPDRFNGFAVGERAAYFSPFYNTLSLGRITCLREIQGRKVVYLDLDDGARLAGVPFEHLRKLDEPGEEP